MSLKITFIRVAFSCFPEATLRQLCFIVVMSDNVRFRVMDYRVLVPSVLPFSFKLAGGPYNCVKPSTHVKYDEVNAAIN